MKEPIARDAVLSECGDYRYWLMRQWDEALPTLVFLMLNPSTADAALDDPTIRKCIGFAKRHGFGRIEVVNLFAYRATKPADLYAQASKSVIDATGIENPGWLSKTCKDRTVVAAWGKPANGRVISRAKSVLYSLQGRGIDIRCLRRNLDGSPAHPLMLPYSCKLEPYNGH